MTVRYDRPLFRSTRALTILLFVYFLLMIALVGAAGHRLKRPPADFLQVYLFIVAIPLFGGVKILTKLWELENERQTPDRAMEFIYSMALLFPVASGIIPVLLILRYAGAFSMP